MSLLSQVGALLLAKIAHHLELRVFRTAFYTHLIDGDPELEVTEEVEEVSLEWRTDEPSD